MASKRIAEFCTFILAHKDETHDIHRLRAAFEFNVPLAEVTSGTRSVGKSLNFWLVYGSGEDTELLGATMREAFGNLHSSIIPPDNKPAQ